MGLWLLGACRYFLFRMRGGRSLSFKFSYTVINASDFIIFHRSLCTSFLDALLHFVGMREIPACLGEAVNIAVKVAGSSLSVERRHQLVQR